MPKQQKRPPIDTMDRLQRQQEAIAYAELRSSFGLVNWSQPLRYAAHIVVTRQKLGIPNPSDFKARMRGVVYGLQPGEIRPDIIELAKGLDT